LVTHIEGGMKAEVVLEYGTQEKIYLGNKGVEKTL
jgi:hypothetical protein